MLHSSIILCKFQDVLMLLQVSTLFQSDFFTTYHNVFLSLVVGAGNWYLHFYHGNATFNIKLISRIIRYPQNNMCLLKALYDSINLLIVIVAMIRLWIF